MKCALKQFFYTLPITGLLVLSGCGGGGQSKDPSGYSTNAQMSVVQNLSVEERAIATRICYAYQSKSTSFRSQTYNEGTFRFGITSRNCVDTRSEYTVNASLKTSSTSMTFIPDTDKPFVSSIQTEQSGYLSQLCGKLQNNKPVSNTVTEGAIKVQINFTKDTMDSYTLRYFAADVNNSSVVKIESMETYKVRTQTAAGGTQILGLDESYSLYQTCGESDKYSEFIQTFSSFTK